MIVFGSLLVSIVISLFFYLANPKEYKWWEIPVTLIIVLAMIIGAKAITDTIGVTFTEYYGETITQVYEQEPYNYWRHRTCSYTTTDSKGNSTTHYYDCSHQVDVGPDWWVVTNLNNKYNISERLHDSLVNVYKTKKVTVKQRSNYDDSDRAVGSKGTKFQGTRVGQYSYDYMTPWPKTDETRKGAFTTHRYENRIKASDLSLFNIEVVTEEQADSMGLYDYPENVDLYNFPTILSTTKVDPTIQEKFRQLNAKFGPTNRMRLWVLVFENKPAITGTYQENYWIKGNLNEMVLCIGKKGNEIQWTYAFSWSLNGTLTAEIQSKALDLYEYTVKSSEGQTLPIAIPIVNTQLKKAISDASGIDTSMLPPALPIPFAKDKVVSYTKSKTPVLTERTWTALYDYLNQNLNKYEKRSHEEFSYIKVEPKTWMIIVIYIIAIGLSVGLNIFMSTNEYYDN